MVVTIYPRFQVSDVLGRHGQSTHRCGEVAAILLSPSGGGRLVKNHFNCCGLYIIHLYFPIYFPIIQSLAIHYPFIQVGGLKATPLKNDGVRQLGWWQQFPIFLGKCQKWQPVTTSQPFKSLRNWAKNPQQIRRKWAMAVDILVSRRRLNDSVIRYPQGIKHGNRKSQKSLMFPLKPSCCRAFSVAMFHYQRPKDI